MSKVLQAILVAPDLQMRRDIVSGKKKLTVRKGRRDYREGEPVMLCCHIEPWAVMADVTSVRVTPLGSVSTKEAQDDGFADEVELWKGLRAYYPGLQVTDLVTVVRWDNVRGKLVEHRDG